MKNTLILLLALIVASCGQDQNKDNKVKSNGESTTNTAVTLDPNNPNVNAVQPPTDQPGQMNVLPDADGVVFHYVCEDLCEGGASNDAGACPVCGKTLAHNQGFHAQDQNNSPQINKGDLPPGLQDLTNGSTVSPMVTTPPPAQEPPQNANGVWHFTCSNGCAGGAGGAVACSSCGTTLVHNADYHN